SGRPPVHEELLEAMRRSILDGDPDRAAALAREGIDRSLPPLEAIREGFVPGLDEVGAGFGKGDLFLPDLVMAGEAMKAATAVLEPELQKTGARREVLGRIVLGTVRGDIHEIGKTLVSTMLSAAGFEVHDLGVDVRAEIFAEAARDLRADIVGVSALLTTTMTAQRDVVEALDRGGLRPRVKLVVGGAPVTRAWADEIGADGYGEDAVAAVTLARSLVGRS
ncbi:MAG: corrinoid protein, partial [Syntrophomonadaceae bacterium]